MIKTYKGNMINLDAMSIERALDKPNAHIISKDGRFRLEIDHGGDDDAIFHLYINGRLSKSVKNETMVVGDFIGLVRSNCKEKLCANS